MVSQESIITIAKNDLGTAAKALEKDDVAKLVEWLSLKDNDIRYQSLLLLQSRANFADDVYPYWEVFETKLKSDNSFQRNIGALLLAENTKWDTENKMGKTIAAYLALVNDEKPITVRQCIQSLAKIVPYEPELNGIISAKLMSVEVMNTKETMRKLILFDILNILALIGKEHKDAEIDAYILKALTGEILDKKTKKQIEAALAVN